MAMVKDPIIQEIHKIRSAYAERFGNDLHSICEAARKKQGTDGRRVVPVSPKPSRNIKDVS